MQDCGNKILQDFLNRLVKELKECEYFNAKHIPFYIAPIWESFKNETYKYNELIETLTDYPCYNIFVSQSEYSFYDYEIEVFFCTDEMLSKAPTYTYVINLCSDEYFWGYCECTPDMEGYRVDKRCCGYTCDWIAPKFELKKKYDILNHSWSGDEHDLWDFEDEFYKSENELHKIAEQERKIIQIEEIRKRIEEDKKRLEELMEDE